MEITTDTLVRWGSWTERRVVAVVNTESKAVEIDGDLKAVHERGVLIRPRGRVSFEMIDIGNIESLELFDDIAKPITVKRMAHILYGATRQHLADRHGFALDELNSKEFTEARAYDVHEAEHAPGSDEMSHYHEG